MKKKIILGLIFLIVLVCGTGITYSLFSSDVTLVTNQKIASFIFQAEKTDVIEVPISDMKPGDNVGYQFQITNNLEEKTSEVTINYQLIIKTYHFMPLEIKLYKVTSDGDELVLNCDETYSRDSNNQLICNSLEQVMSHEEDILDEYKLNISFPDSYNSEVYADLVDFIDIEIKSWQATGE